MKKTLALLSLLTAFNVGQAAQLSYTTPEVDALLVRVDKMGWAYYTDTVHTNLASAFVVNADRDFFTIDGLGSNTETNYLPAGVTELWSGSNIVSDAVGNAFEVRIQFTCDPDSVSDEWFDLQFDIGPDTNSPIVVASRTISSPKGSDPFVANMAIPLFSLNTFVSNGCKIFFEATDSGDHFHIWDLTVLIKQDYYGN